MCVHWLPLSPPPCARALLEHAGLFLPSQTPLWRQPQKVPSPWSWASGQCLGHASVAHVFMTSLQEIWKSCRCEVCLFPSALGTAWKQFTGKGGGHHRPRKPPMRMHAGAGGAAVAQGEGEPSRPRRPAVGVPHPSSKCSPVWPPSILLPPSG